MCSQASRTLENFKKRRAKLCKSMSYSQCSDETRAKRKARHVDAIEDKAFDIILKFKKSKVKEPDPEKPGKDRGVAFGNKPNHRGWRALQKDLGGDLAGTYEHSQDDSKSKTSAKRSVTKTVDTVLSGYIASLGTGCKSTMLEEAVPQMCGASRIMRQHGATKLPPQPKKKTPGLRKNSSKKVHLEETAAPQALKQKSIEVPVEMDAAGVDTVMERCAGLFPMKTAVEGINFNALRFSRGSVGVLPVGELSRQKINDLNTGSLVHFKTHLDWRQLQKDYLLVQCTEGFKGGKSGSSVYITDDKCVETVCLIPRVGQMR